MFQNVFVLKSSKKVFIVSVNILCVLTSSLHILCVYSVWTVSVFSKPAPVLQSYCGGVSTHIPEDWTRYLNVDASKRLVNPILYHHIDHWLLQALAAEVVASKLWQNQNHFNLQVSSLWYGCFPYPSFCQQFTNPTPSLVWTPKHYCDQVLFDQEEYFSKHAYAITLCWQRRCCWWWFQHL